MMRHLLLSLAIVVVGGTCAHAQEAAPQPAEGVVRVGMLVYAGGKSSVCFASNFLDLVARQTAIRIEREFERVELGSDDLYRYPFVIMTGEKAFDLSDDEVRRLGEYVQRGGFLVASAGCSNAAWIESFHKALAQCLPGRTLEPLTPEHQAFHTLYDIDDLVARHPAEGPALYGLFSGEGEHRRLALVFSPLGLNDTANAGSGCCCCGGNEIRNAAQINANLLVYALTH